LNIRVHPGVEFNAVERDAASTEWDFRQRRANFGVEPIAVNAEVGRHIAISD